MNNIIFLGTNFRIGKGGVASVLDEYHKLFPKSTFISTTNSGSSSGNLLVFIRAFFRLISMLINRKNTIFHIHSSSYHSFYRKCFFFGLLKIFRCKIVFHIHSGQFNVFYESANGISKFLINKVINNSDCIVCLTDGWKQYFLQKFKPRNIRIIPNIIAEPNIDNSKKGKIISFLFLGEISRNKGVWDLLEVIIENKEKLEGRAMFYIGGKGETEKLIRIIHKNNLNKIVKFIGWVSGKKKIECLNKTDVFILPSYYEGLSISILEAMSYGLPIISTCVGGTPEIVEDKKNGLLIDPGNKLQLLDAIFYALKNQKELQNYGVVSKRKVTKNLPANVKKELLKLYHFISNN